MSRRRFVCLAPLIMAACAEPPPGGRLDRPILSFDTGAALKANAAALPPGFAGPSPAASCGGDGTRQFIAELLTYGVGNTKVNYQWAPVVPGPTRDRPTIAQPEFYLAGTVEEFHHSTSDLDFSHPFGMDAITIVRPDAAFVSFVHRRSSMDPLSMQIELEQGLFPEGGLGFTPTSGDRVLVRGAWIFDCGHPPYETEIHPPTFVSYARTDGERATIAIAFVHPYRVSQLYEAELGAAGSIAGPDRFTAPLTFAFPQLLIAELGAAAAGTLQRVAIHALLEALRFDSLSFLVCAPSPRPARSWLGYNYRFTARTGVNVSATPREEAGCVLFELRMDSQYKPFVPQRSDRAWSWDRISQEASQESGQKIDIRAEINAALKALGLGSAPAVLADDRPPLIDQFPPLGPRSDAAAHAPTLTVNGADDQPFPVYGRARVFWR